MESCTMTDQLLVDVSVGGVQYRTTLATLTHYPESKLAKMASNMLQTGRRTKDEALGMDVVSGFIDRNGHLFQYVLDYLRTPHLPPLESAMLLQQLHNEARYYEIEALATATGQQMWALKKDQPDAKKDGHFLEVTERIVNGQTCGAVTINICGPVCVTSTFGPDLLGPDAKTTRLPGRPPMALIKTHHPQGRACMAQYLVDQGWTLVSSNYSTKAMYIIRDRWFMPKQAQS